MRAIIQTRYGSPADLEAGDTPKPVAGEGEVLARVRATSVHPDVWHVVSGRPLVLRFMGSGILRPKRVIPGTDMAGIVEAVGPGVTRFQPGDRVFGETSPAHQWINGGAYAEYVAAPEDMLASIPEGVSFEAAAAVPTSGVIALQNLRERSRIGPGRKVLVNGAGGGVGSIALQVAKAHGAHVTAVDKGHKLDMLRSLGADEVVDFTREDFTRRGERYDLIFDVPGDRRFRHLKRALKPEGRYVPIGHDHWGSAGRRVFGLIPHFVTLMLLGRFMPQLRGPKEPLRTRSEALGMLRDLLETGALTPVVESAYPLDEVTEAFRHVMEDEPLGKVLLIP